jgi:hypothetical protein
LPDGFYVFDYGRRESRIVKFLTESNRLSDDNSICRRKIPSPLPRPPTDHGHDRTEKRAEKDSTQDGPSRIACSCVLDQSEEGASDQANQDSAADSASLPESFRLHPEIMP